MEHIVIYGTFVIDTAWVFIFLANTKFGLFVYSLVGLCCCALAALFALTCSPGRAMGQDRIPQAITLPNEYDTQPLMFEQPIHFDSPQPYYFIPPPTPTDSYSTSFLAIGEPLTPFTNESRTFIENNRSESPAVMSRNLTISRDSKAILFRNSQPTKPPKWDFSFPRFQSFNRNKPQIVEPFRVDPSETRSADCFHWTKNELGKIRSDFRNFYSRENFANILVGYGVHAVISNTSMDQNLIDWYQKDVRSSDLNKFSAGVRVFGSNMAIVPVVGVSLLYCCDKITDRVRFFETRCGSFLGEFTSRTTRAWLVGMPTLLLSQDLIGAGRPNYPNPTSRWQPFDHVNGVSGHAFVGAMPFITLAQMSDNFWLKTGFYTCSTLPAWSRFNDNVHYFSQCLVGWYLAYLSCRAVSKTEYQLLPRGLTVFPVIESNTTGIGFVYQW